MGEAIHCQAAVARGFGSDENGYVSFVGYMEQNHSQEYATARQQYLLGDPKHARGLAVSYRRALKSAR